MPDINIGAITEALNDKADRDLRNADLTKTDIVIEYQEPTEENEYTWYRLYASGWVEQGGEISNELATSNTTITLPIKMLNTHYYANWVINGLITARVPRITTKTVTSITLQSDTWNMEWDEPNVNKMWYVSGLADMTHHEILPNPTSNTARALVIQVLEGMYPVGSVYLGTQSVCPMSVFFGTWELVSNGKALWTGDGTNANTTINAGLPNIKGDVTFYGVEAWSGGGTGAFNVNVSTNKAMAHHGGESEKIPSLNFNASLSNPIYSDSVTTVQPPAYVVNVWRRTA